MAKPGQAQDQTMDEILASIRRVISENDRPKPSAPWRTESPAPVATGNVSKLFAEPEPDPEPPVEEPADVSNVVDLAMAQAMEEARAEVAAASVYEDEATEPAELPAEEALPEPEPIPPEAPLPVAEAPPRSEPRRTERQVAPPLLSPQSDAAVAGAFNQLARTMLSRSGRTVDELVEDMVRPMLQSWLDDNLPPLVERLVREEIERVSRGRR